MSETEHAFFLDEAQLLLALSAVDARDIQGLPLSRTRDLGEQDWKQVSLSMLREGWLREGTEGLVPDRELADLLQGVKDAEALVTFYRREGPWQIRLCYLASALTILERSDTGTWRLSGREGPDEDWLEDMLEHPLEENPEEESPALAQTLQGTDLWLSFAPSLEEPPSRWGKRPDTLCLVELRRDHDLTCRWILLGAADYDFWVRQEEENVQLFPDSRDLRRRLLSEMEGGTG